MQTLKKSREQKCPEVEIQELRSFSWKTVGMASMARTWHLDERPRPARKLLQVPWNRPNPP